MYKPKKLSNKGSSPLHSLTFISRRPIFLVRVRKLQSDLEPLCSSKTKLVIVNESIKVKVYECTS